MAVCIKDSLYKRREDLDKSNVDIECVFYCTRVHLISTVTSLEELYTGHQTKT